jgi:hypothetical protein
MSTVETDRTLIVERYRGVSAADAGMVRLVTDLERDRVSVRARVREPVPLREALSVLHEIVRSDLAYKARDRSGYLAWRRMRKRASGLSELAARQEHFAWLSRNDPLNWFVLDPALSVWPDAVVFEVFSKDEATYAQLSIDREALELEGDWVCGTTRTDFTDELHTGIQHIRAHQPLSLQIGPDTSERGAEIVEKRLLLPDRWLRGLLQVQSSMSLVGPALPLAVVDLYSLLRQLRLQGDTRKLAPGQRGRAVRIELVPSELPRLVLEPWEQLFLGTEPWPGPRPEVVRVWGRRRWLLARRFLPFVEHATLHLVGSGLPSFLVLRAGPLALTLGLTGFLASDWARSLQLDALLPRPASAEPLQQRAMEALRQPLSLRGLTAELGAPARDVRAALQGASQQGLVLFDLAHDLVRPRPLLSEPLQPDRLQHRDDRERQAADLLAAGGVTLLREEARFGEGVELVATVTAPAEQREYRTRMWLDEEGRVRQADCTCNFFRSHGLKEGPCPHLLALRMAQARAPSQALETRTFSLRTVAGESITQLSLDHARLKVRWGQRSDERLRVQSLVFDTEQEARAAYLTRIERLRSAGWLDAGGA